MQKIDKVSVITKSDKSDLYTAAIYPTEWKWYYLDSVNSPNYKLSSTNHLWTGFLGLYDKSSLNQINQPYAYGGLSDTALADVISSFNTNGAYVFSLNQEQYRVELNGYNFAMRIPLNSSYTGMTSGLTATTLYTSFIYSEDSLSKTTNSLCAGVKADMITSETNGLYTEKLGVGFAKINGVNPDPTNKEYPWYSSKIAYLVCDDVYYTFTGSTGTSTSWSTGFGNENKYARFGSQLIGFRSGDTNSKRWNTRSGYDRIVGFVDITKGMGIIFAEPLVNGLKTSDFSGSFYTGATPTNSGSTFVVTGDIDYSTQLQVNLTIQSDSPNSTSNPSFIGNGDCGLATDKICLMDKNGMVVALAQFDEAVPLGKITPLEFQVPVDSGINENGIFTRGRIDSGLVGL